MEGKLIIIHNYIQNILLIFVDAVDFGATRKIITEGSQNLCMMISYIKGSHQPTKCSLR